jgi:phosphate transport system substrate-binding protein
MAIAVYSRENSSGTYEFFKEHVLGGKDFTANAQTLQGTAQVVQAVAKEPKSIGYGGAAYAEGIRQVSIKKDAASPAIAPTEENIVNQTYPIWRFLYIYVNPHLDKGEVAAYLTWIRSDEGQAVVKDIGYFPLPKNWRS